MASSDSQIDKPQCGCSKRAELSDVNINTDAQSINTERACCLKLTSSPQKIDRIFGKKVEGLHFFLTIRPLNYRECYNFYTDVWRYLVVSKIFFPHIAQIPADQKT